jgi:NADH dehydrogenase
LTAETPCAVLIRAELPFENPLVRTPPPGPFWYWDKGDLAIAGRTYALADLRMLRFTGFPAWVVWAVVHIYFLIGFANRFFVMLQWVITFLTKRRQVRVFPGQERGAEAP